MMRCAVRQVLSGIPSRISAVALLLLGIGGCEQKMAQQPRYDPMEASRLFENGTSAQAPVEGTVARGTPWREDTTAISSDPATAQLTRDAQPTANGSSVVDARATFPLPITPAFMQRGQERYTIYCRPCHDASGGGNGPVVQSGFPAARSLHSAEIRERPVGFYFEAITNGPGKMPSFAALIPPDDRWAIVAYIRALQLSQHAELEELPAEVREVVNNNIADATSSEPEEQ